MSWLIRGALLIAVLGLGILALRSATPAPVEPVATVAPVAEPRPTIALPTLVPTSRPAAVAATRAPATAVVVANEPHVAAVDFGYLPPRLSVPTGTTVTFRNSGAEGHDVLGSGPGGTWWSGPLAAGETYQRTFTQPGSYDYLCTYHAEMRGRIEVGVGG